MDNQEYDYTQLTDDIVADVNHVLMASLDTTVLNALYSVTSDSTTSNISITFYEPIFDQNDSVAIIVEEIKQGINRILFAKSITFTLLKPTFFEDIMAELSSFDVEGDVA